MVETKTSRSVDVPEEHSRGPRAARRALGIVGAVLLAAPASASHFEIVFDDESARLVTTAFRRTRVDARIADEIVRSKGYLLLFDQVAAGTTPRRDPAEVAQEFRVALVSPERGEDFGLDRARTNPQAYDRALREFRRVSRMLQWEVAARLNELLPPVREFRSTAHLIVGGEASGFAFSHHDDISLRVDDFVGDPGDPLDEDRLASTLCHELFHVGFRIAGGLPPRPDRPHPEWVSLALDWGPDLVGEVWRASGSEEWDMEELSARLEAWEKPRTWNAHAVDRYVALLSRLQNEGSAVYADVPLRDLSGGRNGEIGVARWMAGIDEDFELLALVTRRLVSGASPEEIDELAEVGFRDAGPFYRVGYRMAKRIDGYAGRRPFLATVEEGPLDFFETYFESHPYGPGHVDSITEADIKSLIRQIRAVGALDPDG